MGSLSDVTGKIRAEYEARGYKVHRGAVDWASYNFSLGERVAAIMCDEGSLFQRTVGDYTLITVEAFTKKDPKHHVLDEGDDGLLERMIHDARIMARNLVQGKNEKGDALVFGVEDEKTKWTEVIDEILQVQGLVISISLEY